MFGSLSIFSFPFFSSRSRSRSRSVSRDADEAGLRSLTLTLHSPCACLGVLGRSLALGLFFSDSLLPSAQCPVPKLFWAACQWDVVSCAGTYHRPSSLAFHLLSVVICCLLRPQAGQMRMSRPSVPPCLFGSACQWLFVRDEFVLGLGGAMIAGRIADGAGLSVPFLVLIPLMPLGDGGVAAGRAWRCAKLYCGPYPSEAGSETRGLHLALLPFLPLPPPPFSFLLVLVPQP